MIEKAIQEEKPYDLLVLDMYFPMAPRERMTQSGLYVLEELKNKNINMKALCTLLGKLKEHQVAIEGGGAWLNQRIRSKAETGQLATPENVDCIE